MYEWNVASPWVKFYSRLFLRSSNYGLLVHILNVPSDDKHIQREGKSDNLIESLIYTFACVSCTCVYVWACERDRSYPVCMCLYV